MVSAKNKTRGWIKCVSDNHQKEKRCRTPTSISNIGIQCKLCQWSKWKYILYVNLIGFYYKTINKSVERCVVYYTYTLRKWCGCTSLVLFLRGKPCRVSTTLHSLRVTIWRYEGTSNVFRCIYYVQFIYIIFF